METLSIDLYAEPFPLMVVNNFYNEEELKLIWEELNFYTKPDKLLQVKEHGGDIANYTNAKELLLDDLYGKKNYRNISNILTMNRKLFECGVLDRFSEIHKCCSLATKGDSNITKVSYYHNGEYYDPHIDKGYQFLAFSYFYKEPKKFIGGDLIFPEDDFKLPCENNTTIVFPGWVEHGIRRVTIEDSNYFDGWGKYCISNFFGSQPKPHYY